MRIRLALAFLVLALAAAAARAGEYTGSSGFSLSFPDGWQVAAHDKPNMSDKVRKWVADYKVDLKGFDFVLLGPSGSRFVENVAVGVENREFPMTPAHLEKLKKAQLQRKDMKTANLSGRLQTIGPDKAMVLEYNSHAPEVAGQLWHRQVYFAKDGKVYRVAFSCLAEDAPKNAAAFDSIIASAKLPGSASANSTWIILVTVGCGCGFLLFLVLLVGGGLLARKLLRRKAATRPSRSK